MKKGLIFGFYFIMTVVLTMSVSLAYLDPSSYVIHIFAVIVIALGTVFGFYFKRIRRYFRNKKKEKELPLDNSVNQIIIDENDDAANMLSKD